jgi:predicted methyltransferase
MKLRIALASTWFLLVAPVAVATAAAAQSAPVAATIAETAPIPESKIPDYIKAAVNSPERPAADKALDAGRKPEQMLAFFGIEPGMKVADLWAGGGWSSELLARTVGPDGKEYSQNPPAFLEKFKKAGDAWKARLKEPGLANVVEVARPFDSHDLLPVPPGSLDAVITNMNYHDMVGRGFDMKLINSQVMKALKPGGVYGIIDHSAQPGSGARDTTTLHRIDEALVKKQVEAAGFKLVGESSALRNPKDDRTWFVFKHRGQTDRFMLKFEKPM